MAGVKRFFERLARPPEDVRAENLRRWASSIRDTVPLAEIEPRKRVKAAGVIQNIRIDPREGTGSIEATIIDGTGEIVAKWLGRRSLSGIRLGIGLVLEGVVGVGNDDSRVILNPDYRLVPGPEHG